MSFGLLPPAPSLNIPISARIDPLYSQICLQYMGFLEAVQASEAFLVENRARPIHFNRFFLTDIDTDSLIFNLADTNFYLRISSQYGYQFFLSNRYR